MCHEKRKYSESETSSEETDSSSDVGATTCVKVDRTTNLVHFTENPGVKQIPCDPKKCQE
jgi:hypothetical protein